MEPEPDWFSGGGTAVAEAEPDWFRVGAVDPSDPMGLGAAAPPDTWQPRSIDQFADVFDESLSPKERFDRHIHNEGVRLYKGEITQQEHDQRVAALQDQGDEAIAGQDYEFGAQLYAERHPRNFVTQSIPYRAVEQAAGNISDRLKSLTTGVTEAAADALGYDTLAEGLGERRQDTQADIQRRSARHALANKDSLIGETPASWVQGGLSAVFESIPAAYAGGIPAVAAFFGASETDEQLAAGKSIGEAIVHGIIEGGFTLLSGKVLGAGVGQLSKALGGRAGAAAGSEISEHVARYLSRKFPISEAIAKITASAGAESANEWATEASHYFTDIYNGREEWSPGRMWERTKGVLGPSLIAGGAGRGLAHVLESRQKTLPTVAKAVADAESFQGDPPPTSRRGFEKATGQKNTSKEYREAFVDTVQAIQETRNAQQESVQPETQEAPPGTQETQPAETPAEPIGLRDQRLPDEAAPEPRPQEPLGLPDRTEGPRDTEAMLPPREMGYLRRRVQGIKDRTNTTDEELLGDLDWMLENRPTDLQAVFSEAGARAAAHNGNMKSAKAEWKSALGKLGSLLIKGAKKYADSDGDSLQKRGVRGFERWDTLIEHIKGETEGFVPYPRLLEEAYRQGDGDVSSGMFKMLADSSRQFANKTADDFFGEVFQEALDAQANFAGDFGSDEFFQKQQGMFDEEPAPSEFQPVVEPYKVPDDKRLPPSRRKKQQPLLEGMPEDMNKGTLEGQQGLFQHTNPREAGDKQPFEAKPAAPQGEFERKLHGVPMPEMVELAKELLGRYPDVGGLRKALGKFIASRPDAQIKINESLGGDPQQLAQTLAHEIGHLTDWLPDKSLARGNILGRIGSLRKYMGGFLEGRPGGEKPLTDEDRTRLKEEARRILEGGQKTFDEISAEFKVKPEDILAIWNSLDTSKLPPGLLQYVKGLSTVEKASIVKAAFKGVVPSDVQAAVDRAVGAPGGGKPTKGLDAKWQELIEEEIRKRELLSRETISEELKALTRWWSGEYGDSGWYKKYRESSVELYAEALSVFLNSPGELAARAPEFYRGFSNWIGSKPEVFAEYMRLQDILNGTPESVANRRQYRAYDMFERGEEKIKAARAIEEAGKSSAWEATTNFLHQYAYDALVPSKKLFDKPGPAIYTLDELFTNDSPNQAFLSRVDRMVSKPVSESGANNNDLGAYLLFDRIANGDREQLINPLGHTPETAKQQLENMQRELGPEKWKQLQKSASTFHSLVYDIGQEAYDAGLFTEEQMQTLRNNAGHYATFWITDHIDSPRISPMMRKQIGTFKETANPFVNTILKTMALNRLVGLQKARNVVVDRLKEAFPQDISEAHVPHKGWVPTEPPSPGNEYLHHFENGKHKVYEVPSNIAKSFKNHDIGGIQRMAAIVNSKVYGLFHPLYVTASAGFTVANPFRDLGRTWKNLSAIAKSKGLKAPTLREILRTTVKNFDVAYARAKGKADPRLEKLFDEHVLGSRLTDVMSEGTDTEYERMLKERGFVSQYSQNRAIKAGQKVMAFLEAVGTFQETAVKAAADEMLEQRGIKGQEKSYIVRKYAGTPDYFQKAHATTLLQSLFMYARVKLNGLMTDAKLATGKETAASWWWRTAAANLLPTTLTRLALYGVFGAGVQAMMRNASSGLISNYILVPLGLAGGDDEEKKSVFLSIPQDDTGRMVAAIYGNLLDAMVGDTTRHTDRWDALGDAFGELASGVLPTANPLLSIADKWIRYGRGQNPTDPFTNQKIVPTSEFTAGGWPAAKKMLSWTADQFGVLSSITHPVTEKLLGSPYRSEPESGIEVASKSIPGVSRLLRVTDAGLTEEQWNAIEREEKADAQFKMQLPDEVRQLTRERFRLQRTPNRTQEEQRRLTELNAWYRGYLRDTKAMKEGDQAAEGRLLESSREAG